MAALLGRLRREMNGAVVEAMERAGVKGVLNYGVSIPTIRSIAREQGTDHAFARFLYRQQVRELRMAALSMADPGEVTPDELAFWLGNCSSVELLDELALRLLCRCSESVIRHLSEHWLHGEGECQAYVAVRTLTRVEGIAPQQLLPDLCLLLERFPHSAQLPRAVLSYFTMRLPEEPLPPLPETPAGAFVREGFALICG